MWQTIVATLWLHCGSPPHDVANHCSYTVVTLWFTPSWCGKPLSTQITGRHWWILLTNYASQIILGWGAITLASFIVFCPNPNIIDITFIHCLEKMGRSNYCLINLLSTFLPSECRGKTEKNPVYRTTHFSLKVMEWKIKMYILCHFDAYT